VQKNVPGKLSDPSGLTLVGCAGVVSLPQQKES
jgi:hypothetical protein